MQQKFYVGPKLLSDIRKTITRVNAIPEHTPAQVPPRSPDQALNSLTSFKIGTVTGPWALEAEKSVAFDRGTSTATVVASNMFYQGVGCELTSSTSFSYNVGIARHSTNWYLVSVPMEFTRKTVLDDITLNITLNTESCAIITERTNHTSLMEYARLRIDCPPPGEY